MKTNTKPLRVKTGKISLLKIKGSSLEGPTGRGGSKKEHEQGLTTVKGDV